MNAHYLKQCLSIPCVETLLSLNFRKKSKSLVLGHEDGIVRVYSLPQSVEVSGVDSLEVCLFEPIIIYSFHGKVVVHL